VASTLQAAAAGALSRAAPDEAVAWLERALAEQAALPTRAELFEQLGMAMAIGRDPGAIGALQEAHELAVDPETRTRTGVVLAELLAHAGQWRAALSVVESIEGEIGETDIERRAEVAAIKGAVTLFDPAGIDEFDSRLAENARLASLDYWPSHALAVLLAVEAITRGRPEDALAFAERAREGGRLLRERGAGSWTAPNLLSVFVYCDELDRCLVVLEEVDAAARDSGSAVGLMTALAYRVWIHARLGDLAAAEADLTGVFALAKEAGLLMGLTTASFLLVDVLLEREAVAPIGEMLEQVELPEDFLGTISGAMLLETRGRLRLLHRDQTAGINDLRTAGRILSAMRFGPAFSSWRSALAVALPTADRSEALELATEELSLARATGLPRPLGISLRTLGILHNSVEGIEFLRESVAALEKSSARLEWARSLVELGAALRRSNRRSEGRAPLIAGLRLAHECGANRLVERAKHELRASGGRQPRMATTGRDALTASELRVAELAVAGATNSMIAQELYVSLKTVETHLSRAYGKLGLAGSGSRRHLAAALGLPDSGHAGARPPSELPRDQ
jgi:DNA-binding CsgD family transcriptional regulator